jgi:hypothetical protein
LPHKAYLNCNQSAIVFWFAADRDSSEIVAKSCRC